MPATTVHEGASRRTPPQNAEMKDLRPPPFSDHRLNHQFPARGHRVRANDQQGDRQGHRVPLRAFRFSFFTATFLPSLEATKLWNEGAMRAPPSRYGTSARCREAGILWIFEGCYLGQLDGSWPVSSHDTTLVVPNRRLIPSTATFHLPGHRSQRPTRHSTAGSKDRGDRRWCPDPSKPWQCQGAPDDEACRPTEGQPKGLPSSQVVFPLLRWQNTGGVHGTCHRRRPVSTQPHFPP